MVTNSDNNLTHVLRMPNSNAIQGLEGSMPLYENTRIAIVRSYQMEIEERVNQISRTYPVQTLGDVVYSQHRYPIFRISNFKDFDPSKITILISGGVHGDEPAGVYSILKLFETQMHQFDDKFQFITYPCVNPSGFEASTLETMGLANLNRLFGTNSPPDEVRLIQDDLSLLDLRFRFAMDMHEAPPYYVGEGYSQDDNPHGCWLYETQRDKTLHMGREIIDTLPKGLSVCDWNTIYDDQNNKGVIAFLPETTGNSIYAQQTSFDGYVFERYTGHSFTTETPTGWSVQDRIKTHIHFLSKALEVVSNMKEA